MAYVRKSDERGTGASKMAGVVRRDKGQGGRQSLGTQGGVAHCPGPSPQSSVQGSPVITRSKGDVSVAKLSTPLLGI